MPSYDRLCPTAAKERRIGITISHYSKTGLYHRTDNRENEDYMDGFAADAYVCAALADGVSTCRKGLEGARAAVETVLRLFRTSGDTLWELSNRSLGTLVLEEVRYELEQLADRAQIRFQEYASTLAFAVYCRKTEQLYLFSLGDSAVLLCSEDRPQVICRPCGSRAETFTTVTENGCGEAYISRQHIPGLQSVVLLSDGGWMAAEPVLEQRPAPLELTHEIRHAIEQYSNTDDSSFIAVHF